MVFGLLRNRRNKDTQSVGEIPLPKPDAPEHGDGSPKWSQLELFKGLSTEEIQAFQGALTPKSFASGAVIMKAGDVGNAMYLLESGRVRLEVETSEGSARSPGFSKHRLPWEKWRS